MPRLRMYAVATLMVTLGSALASAQPVPSRTLPGATAARPLFKDFIAINGHFTFKPDLYRPAAGLVRNYHNLNWDVKQPGDPITFPVCVNKVDWKGDVYARWQKAGFETDICLQFSGFDAGNANYQKAWAGKEQWCYDYGKAIAAYGGPSGREKLYTSIEIGNEPGAKFDATLYKTIFRNMAEGIRAGDPRVKILTATAHARDGDNYAQDLRRMYADADLLPLYDAISVHTYAAVDRKNSSQSPWNRSYPEDESISYLKVVDEVIEWRDKNAKGKEVWITEFGYDACTPEAMKRRADWFQRLDWQGTTDLQQAQYLVRSFFAFAERDIRRAYIYYYDDKDSPSAHGSAGLTRNFVPKMSFWAVRQLHEVLADYRFSRVVKREKGGVYVYEFEHGEDPGRLVWAVWSPTGARTNEKDNYVPREARITLTGLPGLPEQVLGMATTDGGVPKVAWERAGPSALSLTVGESPAYIVMRRGAGN
ncbi:MAG: hypothetical protein ACHRHE_10780 [Tepidisphaerales bacterium]